MDGDLQELELQSQRLYVEQAFDYLDAEIIRVCQKDVPLPYAANLEKLALPQIDDIVAACKQACYRN